MTNKEAIKIIRSECYIANLLNLDRTRMVNTALDKAVEALEQEPCDDAISKQAVLDAMYELCNTGETLKENPWRENPHIDAIVETIERLPSGKLQAKSEV